MSTSHKYSPLHVHFYHKNYPAFRQALEAAKAQQDNDDAPLSMSDGRSWQNSYGGRSYLHMHAANSVPSEVVNGRDPMGRSVIHLLCSSIDDSRLVFLEALLAHPLVDVNIQDVESGWTPLHRALWVGNISAAVLLVARRDIQLDLKDHEGYTAFDLYNSTVEGTIPQATGSSQSTLGKDLYLWGNSVRNSVVGLKDDVERVQPERVELDWLSAGSTEELSPSRFQPVKVKDFAMARLHSVAVTNELAGNVRASGIGAGTGNRLPSTSHLTSSALVPLPHVARLRVSSVAVGQDHTLLLTDSGHVYSWGLNRFHQLGYPVEQVKGTSGQDEQIQAVARRVTGDILNEIARGVAASKIASSCWTWKDVFTWGTNRGQLGYSRTAQPVQVLPRKVTPITAPVLSAAISDSALCVLLQTHEIICFAHDTYSEVKFSLQPFPKEIRPTYSRSVQARSRYRNVEKITCCEDTFAIIGESGDVFCWNPPPPPEVGSSRVSLAIKPQRIWTSSRQLKAAKDVALASDGTAIIATESGHAWVRSKTTKPPGPGISVKPFSFYRVPFITRVVKVVASPVGTFAALTLDAEPRAIEVPTKRLEDDLGLLLPFLRKPAPDVAGTPEGVEQYTASAAHDVVDFLEEGSIPNDVRILRKMCVFLENYGKEIEVPYTHSALEVAHMEAVRTTQGGNVRIAAGPFELSIHSSVLVSRSSALRGYMESREVASLRPISMTFDSTQRGSRLEFRGCHPLTLLLLLQYLYTDDVVAVWDRRVHAVTEADWKPLEAKPDEVKQELLALSRLFGLARLEKVMEGIMKILPSPSLADDIAAFFSRSQAWSEPGPTGHDVVLELSDRTVKCHSAILRVRSNFFAGLFEDPDWTSQRRSENGLLAVNLKHLNWEAMEYVFRHMYCSEAEEMFVNIAAVKNADELVDLLFRVLATADELLIDNLVLICSRLIIRHVNLRNVCTLLRNAAYYRAIELVGSLQQYICVNLESILQSRLLEALSQEDIRGLAASVQSEQLKKQPTTRSNKLVTEAMEKWASWLDEEDIPKPFYTRSKKTIKRSPTLDPEEPAVSPQLRKMPSLSMRTASPPTPSPIPGPSSVKDTALPAPSPSTPSQPWRPKHLSQSLEKTDLRSIMESQRDTSTSGTPKTRIVGFQVQDNLAADDTPKWTPKLSYRERRKSQQNLELNPPAEAGSSSASPWKVTPSSAPTMAQIHTEAQASSSSPTKPTQQPHLSGLSRALEANKTPVASTSPKTTPSKDRSSQSSMGPVINPIKLSSFGNISVTTKKSGDAWSPKPEGQRRSSGSSARLQKTSTEPVVPLTPKKSLLQIQEEEQDRQAQLDFEKWWAAEEARVKAEEEALIAAATAASLGGPPKQQKGRPRKKKSSGPKEAPSSSSHPADKPAGKQTKPITIGDQKRQRVGQSY